MNRDTMLARIDDRADPWDLVVIGGGATGVGVALDAAARGYDVVLFEAHDLGTGTSSRSTKLVHGGVRYLRQGNLPLVMEALRERGILRRNAPHLVTEMPFVVPNYDWWEAPFYGIGLKVYDALAGQYGFGSSRHLSRDETIERLPTIEREGLRGGVVYHDGQFDDARLLIHLAVTAAEQGAVLLNHAPVEGVLKDAQGFVCGVRVRDIETDTVREVRSRGVINATGVFTDAIRRMDRPGVTPMIRPSQGIHLVLDRRFHPGDAAIMVPHTDDGRVLFAVPWHDRVLVGTTDTPVDTPEIEPRPFPDEIRYILRHAARYLEEDPTESDVLSAFAGLRPLVGGGDDDDTSALSRDHTLQVSKSGLVTITGGKWTTYRKMAEDTVDHAAVLAGLDPRPCTTCELRIHGAHAHAERFGWLCVHGTDALLIEGLAEEVEGGDERLDAALPHIEAEVRWAAREEMARTVDDVLARRTRALLLDARAALRAAPRVGAILAEELGRDTVWEREQVADFTRVAEGYLVN
ncbi:MAG: glycerol-3-phosphate dehydrogenase/oxidase [Longimicrobiales bacterium]|nr:glycerol-3-phosphate dehydrogenase/oxidase [Longimicrobiales bacterium]